MRILIEPLGDQIESDRKLPHTLADELATSGFFKMLVPKDYGGSQITPEDYFLVLEELARVDGSTAWVVALLACNSISSGYLPAHVAHDMFAGNQKAGISGSLAAALREPEEAPNRAVVQDGGYLLSGSWSFASGCMHATTMMALCTLYEEGKPRLHQEGHPEQRWFYFPKPECRIIENWNTLGLKGTGSHGFEVDNLFIPEERTLPASTPISPVHPGLLYSFSSGPAFGHRHIPLAGISTTTLIGVCLGIARGAIDAFIEIAGVTRGASSLKSSTRVQEKVGQAEATLRAARAYQLDTLREAWNSVRTHGRQDSEYLKDLTLAGAHTALMAAEAVDLIWSAASITSVFVSGPFERRFRDIHTATQNGGITPNIYSMSGRHFLGV